MSCGGDDDCDEERNFRAGEDLQRGIRSGHRGGPKVCPLEANRVSARFAAPGEGQEEPQEAGSRSNVERADPRGGTDRAKQMTALRNAIDSLSIVEEAEVCGKKRWGVESRKRKHASRWIRHASHQPWNGIRNIT
jgi:hypothetical protein